jgi:hypothetical protein
VDGGVLTPQRAAKNFTRKRVQLARFIGLLEKNNGSAAGEQEALEKGQHAEGARELPMRRKTRILWPK